MDLISLAKQFPEMSVTVRLSDLLEANEALMRKLKKEAEREREQLREGYGDTLVPREDVLRMLHVHPTTLWRWEKAGYLSPVRIGVKVMYRQGELDRLIGSKTVANNREERHAQG